MTAALPAQLEHDALSRLLAPRYEVIGHQVDETDDYLLALTPALNLKLRHRSNALKLKSLRAVSADHLEQWHTDFDEALPASTSAWSVALRSLECTLEPSRLSSVRTAKRAAAVLRPFLRPTQIVRVTKLRSLYSDGRCRIEVARVAVGFGDSAELLPHLAESSQRFATVCVESEDAREVREALGLLSVAAIGQPRNYMEILHGM